MPEDNRDVIKRMLFEALANNPGVDDMYYLLDMIDQERLPHQEEQSYAFKYGRDSKDGFIRDLEPGNNSYGHNYKNRLAIDPLIKAWRHGYAGDDYDKVEHFSGQFGNSYEPTIMKYWAIGHNAPNATWRKNK